MYYQPSFFAYRSTVQYCINEINNELKIWSKNRHYTSWRIFDGIFVNTWKLNGIFHRNLNSNSYLKQEWRKKNSLLTVLIHFSLFCQVLGLFTCRTFHSVSSPVRMVKIDNKNSAHHNLNVSINTLLVQLSIYIQKYLYNWFISKSFEKYFYLFKWMYTFSGKWFEMSESLTWLSQYD